MDELTNYSFSSSNVPTSRDILSKIPQNQNVIYYQLSGTLTTNEEYFEEQGPYIVTFTRKS